MNSETFKRSINNNNIQNSESNSDTAGNLLEVLK